MKTTFLKQVIPVAVFALAIVGAFTTNAMEKSRRSAVLVDAFKRISPTEVCEEKPTNTCENTGGGPICRVSLNPASEQLWGKNSAGECTVEVYRPE